jgi:aminoglycoside phosphotransferase (APT) family kinase protein
VFFESRGFDGAPRFLGIDDKGREILTFIEGWAPPNLEHSAWSEGQLAAAARLLRGAHDVTRGSALAQSDEVVCHGDPSPVNFVWRDGVPVALIDWDAAHPGERIRDLAYLCWMFVLGGGGDDTGYAGTLGRARRLRLTCDAYGLADRRDLMDAIDAEQHRVAAGIATDQGKRSRDRQTEVLAWISAENEWLIDHRDELAQFL